jgi:tetratricopeptide (TPR) repeat protein
MASILISMLSFRHHDQILSAQVTPIGLRVANAIVSYPKYLFKIFFPSEMAVYYPFPDAIALWQTGAAMIIICIISSLTIFFIKKAPAVIVGWLWFTGTLVPAIGIIQAGRWPAIADRWTYVPAIGIFIMASWGWAPIARRYHIKQGVTLFLAVGTIALLMLISRNQVSYWENSITLFSHALDVTGNNDLAHYNLGVALGAQKKWDEAIYHYNKGLHINPDMAEGHNNLGKALVQKGMIDQAVTHFEQALKIYPQMSQARINLGNALIRKAKPDEALYHYEMIAEEDPNKASAIQNRNALLAILQPTDQINILFKTAVRFAGEKNYGKAVALFQGILAISPDSPTIYYNISCLHAIQGRKADAVDWLGRAVEKGYDNWEKLKTDPDLNNIRNEAGYRSLIKEAEKTAMQP